MTLYLKKKVIIAVPYGKIHQNIKILDDFSLPVIINSQQQRIVSLSKNMLFLKELLYR